MLEAFWILWAAGKEISSGQRLQLRTEEVLGA